MVGLDRTTRALCVSPFHFDGSFATLFPPVAAGGSLVIPPGESQLFRRYFFRTLARERITLTGLSPSYLRLLLASPHLAGLADSALDILPLGGEACPASDIAKLWDTAPRVRLFNQYGPTETTIRGEPLRDHPRGSRPGRGHLDREAPSGQHVPPRRRERTPHRRAGPGRRAVHRRRPLMSGYWGAPKLTAQALRTDVVPGQTVYRTGDLARRDHDGNYVYVDRADGVVKRHAVRISLVELGEVLCALPGVTAGTCVAYDNDGDFGIAAFVVTAGRGPVEQRSLAELGRATSERLPATMLPDVIETVDVLPMTSSNKVDERRLLAEARLRASGHA